MGRTILVTGGAGFIGSHYIRYLLATYSDIRVINADALTYSANLRNVEEVKRDSRYLFQRVDLVVREQVEQLFARKIDEVVHFAAESHVDRSIQGSDSFIRSNIVGTHNLLEIVREKGIDRFIHISTDEVYGSFSEGRADEQTPLAPANPYSASKAASDLLVLAYHHTYQLPVVITRCTNNYGPNQHPEKLIPHLIQCIVRNEPLPIYGDGLQERDWLHVHDHCTAIDRVRLAGRAGQVYHIGAENTVRNIEVAKTLLTLLNKPTTLIHHVTDRPGHDTRYSLNTSKIRHELGWQPTIPFDVGLQQTVEWYLQNSDWWS